MCTVVDLRNVFDGGSCLPCDIASSCPNLLSVQYLFTTMPQVIVWELMGSCCVQ